MNDSRVGTSPEFLYLFSGSSIKKTNDGAPDGGCGECRSVYSECHLRNGIVVGLYKVSLVLGVVFDAHLPFFLTKDCYDYVVLSGAYCT